VWRVRESLELAAYIPKKSAAIAHAATGTQMFNVASFFGLAAQQTKTIFFRKNQFIFCQGARSDSLFYIESGTVKLTVTSSTGKEALLGFYGAGELFGESSFAPDEPSRIHNAIAVTSLRKLWLGI